MGLFKGKEIYCCCIIYIAYVLTIPIRDYGFLDRIIDTAQGVPLWVHLMVIVVGSIVLLILLKIIEMIVRRVLKK